MLFMNNISFIYYQNRVRNGQDAINQTPKVFPAGAGLNAYSTHTNKIWRITKI